MNIVGSYKDLIQEIDMWKENIKAYESQKEALKRLGKFYGPSGISGIDYSQTRVKGSRQMGFGDALERIIRIEKYISACAKVVEDMERCKKRIESKMENLESIDKKVVYMRDIKNMTLRQIADELGYSEIYIKKISAKNKEAL